MSRRLGSELDLGERIRRQRDKLALQKRKIAAKRAPAAQKKNDTASQKPKEDGGGGRGIRGGGGGGRYGGGSESPGGLPGGMDASWQAEAQNTLMLSKEAEIAAKAKLIRSLQGKLEALESKVAGHEDGLAEHSGDKLTLQAKLDALEQQLDAKDTVIETIQGRLERAETDHRDKSGRLREAETHRARAEVERDIEISSNEHGVAAMTEQLMLSQEAAESLEEQLNEVQCVCVCVCVCVC